jgi:cytochrome b involved in lipid metabolism
MTELRQEQKRKGYYTAQEVAQHNHEKDVWVSIFGKVLDLTELVAAHDGAQVSPIVEAAGQDISHWFEKKGDTYQWRTYIHPVTALEAAYTPMGPVLHVPPPFPHSDWANDFSLPWWHDPQYFIGMVTTQLRKIRIINTLTGQEHILDVCTEESLDEIRDRYLVYNSHARSYIWKTHGKELAMDKTLHENGIHDEQDTFTDLRMNSDFYIPAIHLHFADDLTVA